MKKFIVLEGIDGTGKTTLAKLLSKELDCYYYKTPSAPFSEIRNYVDNIDNCQARFFFYFTNILFTSIEIQELLKTNHVICDRYYFSTFSYHYALNQNFKNLGFENILENILEPDIVFYLKADFDTRINRICQREKINQQSALTDNLNHQIFTQKVDEEFSKFKQLKHVRTENKSITELLNVLKKEILSL